MEHKFLKIMKNSVKNIIVVVFLIMVSVVANAQNAGIIAGVGNSKGCFHGAVIDGTVHIENCNGFYAAPVVGVSSVSYDNDETSTSTTAVKFGAQVGYRHGILRPEVSAYYSTKMTIEDHQYSAPELGAALNIDFNRHSTVDVFVAPTVAYKFVKSHKELESETVKVNIPYEGNCFMYGAKAGMMIKVGKPAHTKSVVMNGKSVKYVSHSQLFVKIEASYQTGSVSKPAGDKLTLNEIGATASLVWKF